jgi:hypothetical protein
MTHPLDAFRSPASIASSCAALYPDPEEAASCASVRSQSAQAELFGLLVGGAIGLLIGRFVLSGRK